MKTLDKPTKTRIIFVSMLILLGGALFGYCAVFYPMESAAHVESAPTLVCEAQAPPVPEMAADDPEPVQSAPPSEAPPKPKPRPQMGGT